MSKLIYIVCYSTYKFKLLLTYALNFAQKNIVSSIYLLLGISSDFVLVFGLFGDTFFL